MHILYTTLEALSSQHVSIYSFTYIMVAFQVSIYIYITVQYTYTSITS